MASATLVNESNARNIEQALQQISTKIENSLRNDGKDILVRVATPEIRYGDTYILEAQSRTKDYTDFQVIDIVTAKLFELTGADVRRHIRRVRIIN